MILHTQITFLLAVLSSCITAASAQQYETVRIGEQEWMKRNLDIEADSSYCYKHKPENCRIFGRLYNWETALTICPEGFRLPTDGDWTVLTNALGGLNVAGSRLLPGGDTGFDALFGGNYNPVSDIFSYQFRNAYYWTSTPYSETAAWMRHLVNERTNINRSTVKKHYHFSVRCIRE